MDVNLLKKKLFDEIEFLKKEKDKQWRLSRDTKNPAKATAAFNRYCTIYGQITGAENSLNLINQLETK